PLESPDALRWGARVKNLSAGGVNLMLCYPFKPGATLAVDLHAPSRAGTLLVKVVHVTDQADGTWLLGCEFATALSDAELNALLSRRPRRAPQPLSPGRARWYKTTVALLPGDAAVRHPSCAEGAMEFQQFDLASVPPSSAQLPAEPVNTTNELLR